MIRHHDILARQNALVAEMFSYFQFQPVRVPETKVVSPEGLLQM